MVQELVTSVYMFRYPLMNKAKSPSFRDALFLRYPA